ncbi:hypothetical protein Goshw_026688 [Gossypium schwendimanii]|uniref:CCHC-type domain-containing protein n=1 Tax=Gossypium schwendimanii TaxID=34291 RepID=A0A7J9LID8_GOSSC|nr:hypothetical protein [Gossypium schwendimanii]
MAVYVDLEKPLVSHILINGRKQNFEYESLSTICFHCGRYGHVKNSCPFRNSEISSEKENAPMEMSSEIQNTAKAGSKKEDENFRPWMIVERKSRQKIRENVQISLDNQQSEKEGSRFRVLNNKDMHKEDFEGFLPDIRRYKGKEILHGNFVGKDSATLYNVSGDGMGLRFEGEGSINWPDLEDTRQDKSAVSLDVGNLDSGRHSVVVFHESTQTKENNNVPPPNNFGFSPVISFGSGKAIKNRAQRMPLKESMEFLAESISAFANSNIGAEISVETNVQNFLRAFQEYNAEHMPDVVCLVEPRVSGKKANLIIEKLGFNYSHWVEAVGFSRGI